MRFSLKKIILAIPLFLVLSCSVKMPEDIMPPEKMEEVLYDYHMIQAMSATLSSSDYKEKLMYSYIFEKHNISKADFDSALVWYNRYPKHMKLIYDRLEKRMQQDVDMLGGAKTKYLEGVDLETAFLASNTAELWTGHRVRMLSATPLCNKLTFSFTTPKDSTFIAGDSLVFSFTAAFIKPEDADVKQKLYATVNLDYSDKTTRDAGKYVTESGRVSVAVPRNQASRLKSMTGYIFYFDNDTAYRSKLLLNDLSVKRIHPQRAGSRQPVK